MRVAHRRGDAAIGDDAGEEQLLDAALAQHPFEPRGVERRIGDLLDLRRRPAPVRRPALAPAAGREIALAEERPQRLQMRRDDRLAAAAGHQREQRRDDQHAAARARPPPAARALPAAPRSPERPARRGRRRRRGCRKSFCRSPSIRALVVGISSRALHE